MNTLHYTLDDARALLFFAVLLMLCGVVLLISAMIKHVRRQTNFISNDELASERITVDLNDRNGKCGEFSGWFKSKPDDTHAYGARSSHGACCSHPKGHRGSHSWANDPYLKERVE